MKRIIGLFIVLIGICNWCFANVLETSGESLNYDQERNCFSYWYSHTVTNIDSYVYNIKKTNKESKISDATIYYVKEYDFNNSYDDTNLCIPYEAIGIMVEGEKALDLKDDISILETVKCSIHPVKMGFEEMSDDGLFWGEKSLADIKFFRKLIENEKELSFTLQYGKSDLYMIHLTKEDIKGIKKVMHYDLFKDYSQKENINKAIRNAKKLKNLKVN